MPSCGHRWLGSLRRNLRLGTEDFTRPVRLERDQAQCLELFLILGAPDEQRLRTSALEDAISSREFLIYLQDVASLVPSPELEVMYALLGEVERYRSARGWLRTRQTELFTELETARHEQRPAFVYGHDLGMILALYDVMLNVQRLIHALLNHFADSSQAVQMPQLVSSTPFGQSIDQIRAEQASHEDVDRWRENRLIRDFMTGQHEATAVDIWKAIEQYPELEKSFQPSKAELEFYNELFEEVHRRLTSEGQESAKSYLEERIRARFQP